jgi:hypothetical protein
LLFVVAFGLASILATLSHSRLKWVINPVENIHDMRNVGDRQGSARRSLPPRLIHLLISELA